MSIANIEYEEHRAHLATTMAEVLLSKLPLPDAWERTLLPLLQKELLRNHEDLDVEAAEKLLAEKLSEWGELPGAPRINPDPIKALDKYAAAKAKAASTSTNDF